MSLSKQQDVLALLEEDKVDKETATYTQAHKQGTPHNNPAYPHTSASCPLPMAVGNVLMVRVAWHWV